MKLVCFLLFIFFTAYTAAAQDSTVAISAPIDIPVMGWNQLIQLRNGNTVLLHFENRKGIIVKVFDKARKEIASKKHLCNVIDINALDRSSFDAIYDINGEAVIFLTQEIDNVETLMRLRFDGTTAALLAEDKVVRSKSFNRRTTTYVLKKPGTDAYSVFCYTIAPTDTGASLRLIKFNEKHEVLKEVPYSVSTTGYDDIALIGASIDHEGDILISAQLSKVIQYPDLNERTLALLYMPDGEDRFMFRKMVLPSALVISNVSFTVNPFANTLNLFVTKVWNVTIQNGLNKERGQVMVRSIFIMPKDISGIKESKLTTTKADASLQAATNDTTKRYYGVIRQVSTNDRGVTTVVYEDIAPPDWGNSREVVHGYCGNLCVTQYDDNGEELWATVLPKANYYSPEEVYPAVFQHTSSSEVYQTKCFNGKKSYYLLYNDVDKNFTNSLSDSLQPVYKYEGSNTVYQHINKRNVVTRKYMFGNPVPGENKFVYPGSADFNEQTNKVAVLMRYRKENAITTHLAWRKMED